MQNDGKETANDILKYQDIDNANEKRPASESVQRFSEMGAMGWDHEEIKEIQSCQSCYEDFLILWSSASVSVHVRPASH